jgi:hypothetical protein
LGEPHPDANTDSVAHADTDAITVRFTDDYSFAK